MKEIKLGNLEELVLLLIAGMGDEAYSVAIVEEYEKKTKRSINISAIHTTLYRLQEKGFLDSKLSDSNGKRGGKKKRIFFLTDQAITSLNELSELRNQLKKQIPNLSISYES